MDRNSFGVEEVKAQLPVSLKRKRNVRIKKLEFAGWGSKPLIEFLQSIGKDTSRIYTLPEVTAIVTEYINSNGLFDPQKKKKVMCDARLHSLFGKKFIRWINISDLLEVHFPENHDESEDESSECLKEEDDVIASKGRKSTGSPKNKVPVVPKSCFAAVIAENVKHVYLKRSLVQDLLKTPESFEDKVVGSFVRVKSDPNDFLQRNSHQLHQVEGVKEVTVASDAAFEVHLQLSNLMKDIPISSLSDDNFYEEECENLRQRIQEGYLKRPTVVRYLKHQQVFHSTIYLYNSDILRARGHGSKTRWIIGSPSTLVFKFVFHFPTSWQLELEKKAQVLHKDITKHWIEREVVLLQKRIDHANEKGWRKQVTLFNFLERKQLLQTKKEQDRLFSLMPKVVAEELAPEVQTVDALEENVVEQERENSCSPKSTPNGASDMYGAGDTVVPSNRIFSSEDAIVDRNDQHADMIQEQRDASISVRVERTGEMQVVASGEDVTQQEQVQPTQIEVIELCDYDPDVEDQNYVPQFPDVNPEVAIWHYLDPYGIIQGPFPLTMLKHWSDIGLYFDPSFSVWMVGQSPQEAVVLVDLLRQFFPVQ